MANLRVSIVVRVTVPDGERKWVPAAGKNDPDGPLYLRYYKGSYAKHVMVPPELAEATNLHHWRDCLDSYISILRGKTKRNGWKYKDKSIPEREANILEFA